MDLTQIRGGRDVAEYLAHKAWLDLGNPAPNEGKPQNLNDLQYDAFRHAYELLAKHEFDKWCAAT